MKRLVGLPVSGFVPSPPIDRQAAEKLLGASIPESVWKDVARCFRDHGERLNSLAALPIDNDNRNDGNSYNAGRKQAERKLAKALELIRGVSENRQLCRAASEIYTMKRDGLPNARAINEDLHAATMAIVSAKARFKFATDPVFVSEDSPAKARRDLAIGVLGALEVAGLNTRLTGWAEDAFDEKMSESDMTPAERLLSALAVHDAATPSAFVRWLRGATGKK